MGRLAQLGTALFVLAAAGCGSSSADGTSSDTLDVGSYLLRFESRELNSWPDPEWKVDYRLDLARPSGESGVLEAALAAPNRDPILYDVAKSGGELVLAPDSPPPMDAPGDHLLEIHIALDGTKKVTVSGVLLHYPGEILANDPYTSSGELTSDDVAPTASTLQGYTGGVPALPWLELPVVASEPISITEWQQALSGTDASGANVPLTWSPSADSAIEWAGVSNAKGQIVDWLPLAAGGSLAVSGPSLTDASGNVGALTPFSIDIVGLGAPKPGLDFAQEPGTSWGTMSAVTGTENGCSGTCLLFLTDACAKPAGGFAALLERGTARHVRIHYRVAAVAPDDAVQEPDGQLTAFTAGVEIPGSPQASVEISVLSGAPFQKSAAPVAGLGWVTEPRVATLDLPDPAPAQFGFWLDANRPSECSGYTTAGGPQQDVAVILESIELTDN